MSYLEVDYHYIKCLLNYFKMIIYKKGESYYTNNEVDKIFEFEKWINKISDNEIRYNCDEDNNVNPERMRKTLRELIKKWVNKNCEGELL